MDKEKKSFPNLLSNVMSKVGQRIQYESSLLSTAFIIVLLSGITIVVIFGTNISIFMKIVMAINSGAMLVFISSNLITTFQQYQSYLRQAGLMIEESEVITNNG